MSKTTNGWELGVFNDCGQWDYVAAPNGATLASPEIYRIPEIEDYAPETIELLRRWGLTEEEAELLVDRTY